jgi:hypothetical protein
MTKADSVKLFEVIMALARSQGSLEVIAQNSDEINLDELLETEAGLIGKIKEDLAQMLQGSWSG